jgi:malonate-semialdehyde dehydrogenase (acetylating)/methylmalonate-semialdehyde dehydrogenase
VVEYAAGIGRELMGEYVEHVSTGIDTFSIRQPLGVTAGICPFNFPGGLPCCLFDPGCGRGGAS